MILCGSTPSSGFPSHSKSKPKALLQTTRPCVIQSPHWPFFLVAVHSPFCCIGLAHIQIQTINQAPSRSLHWLSLPSGMFLLQTAVWLTPSILVGFYPKDTFPQKPSLAAVSKISTPTTDILYTLPCLSFLSSAPPNIFYILLIYVVYYLSPRKHPPQGPGILSVYSLII